MPIRNQESRINEAAIINYQRSKFDYGQDAIFTGKMGDLIPFFCDPTIMVGDTFQLNINIVCRLTTPIYPIMTPLYLETFAFFVPNRLIWEHAKEFWGENPDGAWVLETEYIKPKLSSHIDGETQTGFKKCTIADYLYGTRLGVDNIVVDALPTRAVTKCYNDWFRNQNLIAPIQLDKSDQTTYYDADDPAKGGKCFKIAKYGDIFTRSLPAAQKGQPVKLPIGLTAPIYGNGKALLWEYNNGNPDSTRKGVNLAASGITLTPGNGSSLTASLNVPTNENYMNTHAYYSGVEIEGVPVINIDAGQLVYNGNLKGGSFTNIASKEALMGQNSNLYADLSEATAAPIDSLIEAFAIQNIMHRMGIGGSRYEEIAYTFWGTTPSEARMQIAEYLGGTSTPINFTQIAQTGSSDSTSPQGNLAAFSHTIESNRLFTKSFTEHGIILIFAAIRQRHSYSQGTERCYTSFRRYDNYMPPLANLGDMPVKKGEIFATGTDADNETFGFQEAWYWMRGIRPSKVMGDMRPDLENNMAAWHAGDVYQNAPVLSQEFIEETDEYLLRTLSVTDQDPNIQSGQWQFATYVYGTTTRVMPTHAVPGLRLFF